MKRFLVLLLTLTMTFTLAGCSKNKDKETLTPPEDNFEEDASEEDNTEEPAEEEAKEPEHDAAVAKELESVSAVYNGVIRAMYQPDISKDGVSYVASDSQFFWLAVYFTTNQADDSIEGVTFDEKAGTYTITADLMAQYAESCFGTKQSLPEIPQEVTYVKKDGDNYVITASDTGDTGTTITKAYKNEDGTYTAIIEFSTSEGTLGTYKVSFQDAADEDALFKYQVTDAVLVK